MWGEPLKDARDSFTIYTRCARIKDYTHLPPHQLLLCYRYATIKLLSSYYQATVRERYLRTANISDYNIVNTRRATIGV